MWRTKFFTALVILGLLISFQVLNSYAQGSWKIIRQIDTLTIYTDVDFVDKNNGWVVGYVPIAIPEQENEAGVIIHTRNGGESWEYQKFKTGGPIYAVDFLDSLYGWALAEHEVILRTKDGGKNWEADSILHHEWWWAGDICFVDTLKGWIIGNNPREIYNTKDGGKTWDIQYSDADSYLGGLFSVFFVDSLSGWASDHNKIFHSADGGKQWIIQYQANHSKAFGSIHFINSQCGWIIWDVDQLNGSVLKTTDGGQTWRVIPTGRDFEVADIHFVNSRHGWIVTGGQPYIPLILYTEDGGESWISQETEMGEGADFSSVCFIDSCTGWAIGKTGWELAVGTVLTYSCGANSVESNTLNRNNYPNNRCQLLQNYPNPFNSGTTFRFYNYQVNDVRVSIYDIQGRLLKKLLAEHLSCGFHKIQWNGLDQQGKPISSGIYLCVLETEENFEVIKLVAIK